MLEDKLRAALNRQHIMDIKPVDMVYVDLRMFGEAWAHQDKLPGALDSVHVMAVMSTRW